MAKTLTEITFGNDENHVFNNNNINNLLNNYGQNHVSVQKIPNNQNDYFSNNLFNEPNLLPNNEYGLIPGFEEDFNIPDLYNVNQYISNVPFNYINDNYDHAINFDDNISPFIYQNKDYNNNIDPSSNSPLKLTLYKKKDYNAKYANNINFTNNIKNNIKLSDYSHIENLKENETIENENIENENNNISLKKTQILNMPKIKEFSPDFWKKFYSSDDPFFNYNANDGDIPAKKTLTNIDPEDPNITETYIGEVNKKGEKNGLGKLIRPEVTRIGTWRNNEFTGWGREIWESGEILEGKFIKGKINGKGIYKDDSVFYIGNFRDSNKHGKGELFTDKFHYSGNFNNNNFDGKGRIDIYNEGIYEGNFNNGNINGYGIFKSISGKCYEGEVKDGAIQGYKINFKDENN